MSRQHPLLLALAALAAVSIALPLVAIVLTTPWSDAGALLMAPQSRTALGLSLGTAALAALIALLLGFPLALLLARGRFPGRALLRALVLVPLVLPPVVSGFALLMTFGRRGLLGALLEAADLRIVFTTAAVVIAQVFVALPFTVLTLESGLRSLGTGQETAAAQLGAGPWRVLTTITLPRCRGALLTAAVLAFARALGEFGATLTFAGSLPGVTRTLPLEIYRLRETDIGGATVLSLLLIAVALVVVLLAYARDARGPRDEEEAV